MNWKWLIIGLCILGAVLLFMILPMKIFKLLIIIFLIFLAIRWMLLKLKGESHDG